MTSVRRHIRAGLLVTACSVAVAACASSGSGGTATNAAGDATGLRFAVCMRAHGVPNFPDPGQGRLMIRPGSGIDPRAPAFQAAAKACRRYAPGKGTPVTMSAAQRRAALRFAACMRSHGVPSFPDPGSGPGPASGAHLMLVLHDMIFPVGAGMDPGSPGFRQAASACGLRLPPKPGG